MARKPVVVGIDPGTSLGYAIISVDGSIIENESSKMLGLSSIIRKATDAGQVIAVGCDRKKPPSFVEKFSSRLGARLVSPDHDLKITEKRELLGPLKPMNPHKEDSLASAFYALKSLKPLLRKIEIYIQRRGVSAKSIAMLYYLVVSKSLSLNSASRRIDGKGYAKRMPEKSKAGFLPARQDRGISPKLEKYRMRHSFLEKENQELKRRITGLESRLEKAREKNLRQIARERAGSEAELLSKRLEMLRKNEEFLIREINRKDRIMQELSNALMRIGDFYVLKRLKDLGSSFEGKREFLRIDDGDMLIVDEPSIVSDATAGFLRDKVRFIVCRKKPPRMLREKYGFIPIDASRLSLVEFGDFFLAERKKIDRIISSENILGSIVKDYRKSRSAR